MMNAICGASKDLAALEYPGSARATASATRPASALIVTGTHATRRLRRQAARSVRGSSTRAVRHRDCRSHTNTPSGKRRCSCARAVALSAPFVDDPFVAGGIAQRPQHVAGTEKRQPGAPRIGQQTDVDTGQDGVGRFAPSYPRKRPGPEQDLLRHRHRHRLRPGPPSGRGSGPVGSDSPACATPIIHAHPHRRGARPDLALHDRGTS